MALENAEYIGTLMDLIKQVNTINTRIRADVTNYRELVQLYTAKQAANAPASELLAIQEAQLAALKHAAQTPSWVQSVITNYLAQLNLITGSQSASITAIDAVLSAISAGTLSHTDFNNHVSAMITVANAAIDGYKNSGWTLDQVATYFENNVPDKRALILLQSEASWVAPW